MTKKQVIFGILVVAGIVVVLVALQSFFKKPADVDPDAAAQQAAGEAAQSQNPFKASSPLADVETNPFEKTKKVLNPFEE